MIVREKLTFPSGTATAQLIGVLHNKPLLTQRASTASGLRRRSHALDEAEAGR